jgi:hypothetical protein
MISWSLEMECFDGLCIGHLPIELNAVHVDGMLCNAIDISANPAYQGSWFG